MGSLRKWALNLLSALGISSIEKRIINACCTSLAWPDSLGPWNWVRADKNIAWLLRNHPKRTQIENIYAWTQVISGRPAWARACHHFGPWEYPYVFMHCKNTSFQLCFWILRANLDPCNVTYKTWNDLQGPCDQWISLKQAVGTL